MSSDVDTKHKSRRKRLRDPQGVQVLQKVGALLDCLADEEEATAGRLAERIGEPRSTVYRLLASLQALEFVEPGSDRGTYRLGLALLRLGSTVLVRFDERRIALPVMEHIQEVSGLTVMLCIRRGHRAVVIERIDGKRSQSLVTRLGGTLPLHVGAAPRVLLAFESHEFRTDYLSGRDLESFTGNTATVREEVLENLGEIRRLGYALSNEDVKLGIAAVGAPIFDFRGSIRAALSISGGKSEILGASEAKLRRLVVEAATDISRSLGFGSQVEGF